MEDSRLLSHAIDYLNRMADGLNPLTGAGEPEDSCLRQPRVSRCLRYTIEVMEKVLNGELIPADSLPAKAPTRPFQLTPEQMAQVHPNKGPLSLTRFLEYLRGFADPDCKKLSHKQTVAWLISQGLLEKGPEGTAITPSGQDAGIYLSQYGFKQKILYTPSAQQWILDRLPELMDWISRSAGGTIDPETGELIARSSGKQPFSLTQEQLDEIPLLPGGVSISRLVQEINRHIDTEKMDKLKRETLTGWLTAEGYLEKAEHDGHSSLSPTSKGEQNGIRLEQRTVNGRSYWGTVYYDEGQMLLLDYIRKLCGLED